MSAPASDHSCEAVNRKTDSPTRYSAIYTDLLANEDTLSECSYNSDLDDLLSRASASDTILPYGSVAAWQLAEIGYKYIPMYVPIQFSETESYTWEDTLKSIDDYDWSVKGHNFRVASSNGSADHVKNTSVNTSSSFEDLTAFSVKPFQDRPALVTTVLPYNKSGYFTLGADGERISKASGLNEINTRDGTHRGIITRSTLDMQYANKSALGTRELQIDPFERIEGMLPAFGIPNSKDALEEHKRTVSSAVLEDRSILDCSLSRYSIMAPQYDERYSSDEENHEVNSPTETVATSVAEIPPFSVEELGKSEKDVLFTGLRDMMSIDKANETVFATITRDDALGKYLGTVEGSRLGPESNYIVDVDEIEQHDTPFLLAIGNGIAEPVTTANPVVQSCKCCSVECVPALISKHRNYVPSHPSEETVNDGIPLTVVEQPVIKNGTLAHNPSEEIVDNTNAQSSEKSRLPLVERLTQEAGVTHESNNLGLSAGRSRNAASSIMTIAERHAELLLESPYHTVDRQSSGVVSLLKNPTTESPAIDIASIMLSLATYSPDNLPLMKKLKRSIDSVNFAECVVIEQPTKKQRLGLEYESADIEDISISKVSEERRTVIGSYESFTSREATIGALSHFQDHASVSYSPANTAVQAVYLCDTSVLERTKFKLQVGNLATDMLLRENWGREAECASASAHLAHFLEARIQTTDIDMQGLVTTHWMSPSLESSTPALNSFSKPCGSKITLRTLQFEAALHTSAKVEALGTGATRNDDPRKQNAGETETHALDGLGEIGNEEPGNTSVFQPKPVIQTQEDMPLTPQPIAEAVRCSEPAPNNGPPASDTQTTPKLLRELDVGHDRRTMHSATAITADASSTYLESGLDEREPLLAPKEEKASVPSPSITSKDITLGRKNKHIPARSPNPRQTRSGVTKTKAISTPKSNADLAQKSTSKTTFEATTLVRPEILPITPKMELNAKTNTSTPTKGLGKRVTRHAFAVENEIKKATEKEENIGKRLRSKS